MPETTDAGSANEKSRLSQGINGRSRPTRNNETQLPAKSLYPSITRRGVTADRQNDQLAKPPMDAQGPPAKPERDRKIPPPDKEGGMTNTEEENGWVFDDFTTFKRAENPIPAGHSS